LARRTTTHPAPFRFTDIRMRLRARCAPAVGSAIPVGDASKVGTDARGAAKEGSVGSVIKKRRKKMRKHKKRKLLRKARHKRKR
jgi:hypothetical protein